MNTLNTLLQHWFYGRFKKRYLYLSVFLFALSIQPSVKGTFRIVLLSFVAVLCISYIAKIILRKRYSSVDQKDSKIDSLMNILQSTDSLTSFISALKSFKTLSESITKNERVAFPSHIDVYSNMESASANIKANLQWWLRDVIEREGKNTKQEIKTTYHNSRERMQDAYNSFFDHLDLAAPLFDKETFEFANKIATDVYLATSADFAQRALLHSSHAKKAIAPRNNKIKWSEIDAMDGHQFEYFCAELLRENGFCNVAVTPGSSDQGVDVLAEKDGIRYAIQCKCYSSALGNTPIQEAYAGKEVYRCHIAVVMTNNYFTPGAKQAAHATGVLLWDREKMQEMLVSSDSL